jgi:hypothetical protein
MLKMEYYFEPTTEDFLRQAYEVDGLSQKSIGKMCNLCQADISKKLKEFSIDTGFEIWTEERIKKFCLNERPNYEFIKGSGGLEGKYIFKYIGDNIPDYVDREFEVKLASFVQLNANHPLLSSSKGEEKIYQYLSLNDYEFEKEFTFNDCRGINDGYLRFDFAIFFDNEIKLIEYDGKQHFESVEYWGGDSNLATTHLATTQANDKIKDKYCKENNIDLLRIPYWDFDNIDVLIDDFIKV